MRVSLLPLRRLELRTALYPACRQSTTKAQKEDLSLFREINELAREGRWNDVTNAPSFLSLCNSKALYAFRKLNASEKHPFLNTDYGQVVKATVALSAAVAVTYLAVYAYEWFVPEENRLKYKYRSQHEIGHH